MCRRAFLEQAKHERVGMQNGLQNDHLQNSEAHMNGYANGHAEHTLDIEVTISATSVPLQANVCYTRAMYASWLGTMPSMFATFATGFLHTSSGFSRALSLLCYLFCLSSQVAHPCLALATLRGATTLVMRDGFGIMILWLLNKAAHVSISDADNQGVHILAVSHPRK